MFRIKLKDVISQGGYATIGKLFLSHHAKAEPGKVIVFPPLRSDGTDVGEGDVPPLVLSLLDDCEEFSGCPLYIEVDSGVFPEHGVLSPSEDTRLVRIGDLPDPIRGLETGRIIQVYTGREGDQIRSLWAHIGEEDGNVTG